MSPPFRSGHGRLSGSRPWLVCMLGGVLAGAPRIAAAQGGIAEAPTAKSHIAKPAAVHPAGLAIASLGGGLQDAQQATLFAPFSAQGGAPLQLATWDGSLATLQLRAQTGADAGSAGWGLILMEDAPVRVACRQGLLLSNPDDTNPGDANPAKGPDSSGRACGVAAWRMNLVLAWDKSRVDMAPTWTDFWDVARRPGKRGLRRDPRGTLEIALMADGVSADDVYHTLATGDGVDRAFRKLDQLKPYIVWWNTPAEAVQIIESGAVLMTSAPSGEIATADAAGHRSFGTQWAQSLGVRFDWAVPRATTAEQRTLARAVLEFLADPARQADFLSRYEAVPVDDQAKAATPAAGDGPGTPDHERATLMMDDSFWADHMVELDRRFTAWLARK